MKNYHHLLIVIGFVAAVTAWIEDWPARQARPIPEPVPNFSCHGGDPRFPLLAIGGYQLGQSTIPRKLGGELTCESIRNVRVWLHKDLGALQLEGEKAVWNNGEVFLSKGDVFTQPLPLGYRTSDGTWKSRKVGNDHAVYYFRRSKQREQFERTVSLTGFLDYLAVEVVAGRVERVRLSKFRSTNAFGEEELEASELATIKTLIEAQSRFDSILAGPTVTFPAPKYPCR